MGLLDKIRQTGSSIGARIAAGARGIGAGIARVARTPIARVGLIAASITPLGRVARGAQFLGRGAVRLGGAIVGTRAVRLIGGGALGGGLATIVAGRGNRQSEITTERETSTIARRRVVPPVAPRRRAPARPGVIRPRLPRPTVARPRLPGRPAVRRVARRAVRGVRRVGRFVRAHKATIIQGLDIAHRVGKKGISLKTIRASIASPRTPEQLKRGLRKLLRKRSAHRVRRGHR